MNEDELKKLIEQSSQTTDVDMVAVADAAVAANPEGDIFSWLKSMWDMTKGNGNPDIKEMDERDLWIAGGGDPDAPLGAYNMPWQWDQSTTTAADMGKFTSGRYITDDDTQMRGILEDVIGRENVSYQQDKNGNTVVVIDGAPEPYYLNKPGLSMADVERVAGQLASFSPASRLATWGTRLGRAIKTGLGMGGTQAARELTAEDMGGGDPSGNRILLVAALGSLSVPVSDAVGFAGKRTWEGLKRWFGKDGDLSDAAMKELQKAGVYSEDLTVQLRMLFRDLESKYGQTVAVSRVADELTPENLRTPLTRGDISQDVKAQQFEARAEAGNYGDTAYMVSKGGRSAQQDVIQDAPDVLKTRVGSGVPRNRNDAGMIIKQRLTTMRNRDDAAVRAAYKVVDEDMSSLPSTEHQIMLEDILDNPARPITQSGAHLRDTLTEVNHATSTLTKILEKDVVSIAELQAWRKDWSTAAFDLKGSGGRNSLEESRHIGTMIANFDRYMDNIAERGLILGDIQSVRWWQEAIKLRREFGKNWQGEKGTPTYIASKVTDTTGKKVITDDEAANFILNSTQTQFYNQPALTQGLKIVRDRLGADSQEWLSIVDEVTLRMLNNASKGSSGTFKPNHFMKEWMQFKETNRGLVNLLYTLDEQKMISRWIYNAAKAGKKAPGGYNPSGTALFQGLPLVKHMRKLVAGRQATKAYSGQLPASAPSPHAGRMAALASQQAAMPIAEQYPQAGYAAPTAAMGGYDFLKKNITGLLGGPGGH